MTNFVYKYLFLDFLISTLPFYKFSVSSLSIFLSVCLFVCMSRYTPRTAGLILMKTGKQWGYVVANVVNYTIYVCFTQTDCLCVSVISRTVWPMRTKNSIQWEHVIAQTKGFIIFVSLSVCIIQNTISTDLDENWHTFLYRCLDTTQV